MAGKLWSRRSLVTTTARLATGTAISTTIVPALFGTGQAFAQFPAPELSHEPGVEFVSTTETSPWQKGEVFRPTFRWDMLNLNVDVSSAALAHAAGTAIKGFGACFNDLGWTSLNALAPADRDSIVRELFHATAGARFTYCRMPIGANDFSTGAYSYDETDGDFALQHFSIEHDRKTLIPFIHPA